SYNDESVSTADFENGDDVFSVHFVELGNKYTGDCTYIKYGDVDILIDCGSRANSVSAVSSYLNNYVTDNTLEYVIVTHAHRDHYAGFATSAKATSIFDLYVCENIIDFGNATNQDINATTYKNYIRERTAEIDAGAKHINAVDCRNQDNTNREFTLGNNAKFEILFNEYSKFDNTNKTATEQYKAHSENDYSVCALFTFDDKQFLFTGDLGEEGETKLIENNESLKLIRDNGEQFGVDLYKAGHHGSKTSSSETLLNAIRPEHVAVCCCAGSTEYTKAPENTFPTQQFIDRISTYTSKVFVTTLCVDYEKGEFTSFNGNIVIWTKAETIINVDCSNNEILLKDTDWFKNNRTTPTNWQN
ncbi:MAG: MBL fold metallo-hydrolase, partial [Clostridia bacterium]|nr:MBL fold metallo-hydrolase [Clostridia bacterium]